MLFSVACCLSLFKLLSSALQLVGQFLNILRKCLPSKGPGGSQVSFFFFFWPPLIPIAINSQKTTAEGPDSQRVNLTVGNIESSLTLRTTTSACFLYLPFSPLLLRGLRKVWRLRLVLALKVQSQGRDATLISRWHPTIETKTQKGAKGQQHKCLQRKHTVAFFPDSSSFSCTHPHGRLQLTFHKGIFWLWFHYWKSRTPPFTGA